MRGIYSSKATTILQCVCEMLLHLYIFRYVSQHVGEKTRGSLQQLLVSEEEIDVEFKDYNWQLNKL